MGSDGKSQVISPLENYCEKNLKIVKIQIWENYSENNEDSDHGANSSGDFTGIFRTFIGYKREFFWREKKLLRKIFDEYFRKAHSKLSNISEFELLTLTVTATTDIQ